MTAARRARLVHLSAAPAVFLALVATPLPGVPYAVRGGIGLLIWMSWWWITSPVHLAVTGFLPLAVLAVFDFVPVGDVLGSYAEPLVILLIGANMLAVLWTRWGLDRRIALVALLGIGTGARQHILAWFAIAAILSSVLPNTVVAAAMMPIVVALLRYLKIDDVGGSVFGSALLIAVAWGTSVGGSGTPLGGAPNLLAIRFLEQQVTHHEFLFTTWLARVLPLTVIAAVVAFLYMRVAFRPEMARIEGTHEYFRRQLKELGPMSRPEQWALGLFGMATLLAFTRQLYAPWLPGLAPAFVMLGFGLTAFVLRHRGEPLLTWEYAEPRMIWGLIYLFAGGTALGEVLSRTGAAKFLADQLLGLADGGGPTTVAVFLLAAIALTQITSNTAAVAIAVPITIGTFQSLGQDPTAMVYLVTAAANYGLMLPSSSGGCAVAAGYGVDLKLMAGAGLKLTLLILVTLVTAGYLLASLWPGFAVA
ncbi:MAG TPA: SLC13 family permease [Gammaproteobacteria bacterium]|nr:SLC13 family permease [Gammaproteobacteria bacterium]